MEAFGSVFSTGTLEGSNGLTSMCPSKVSFLNVHPREKPFQTLGHKKTILFFCFLFSVGFEGLGMETFGSVYFYRYTFEGSNVFFYRYNLSFSSKFVDLNVHPWRKMF